MTLFAQQPTQEWVVVNPLMYPGTMCIDSSGNVFISGQDDIAPYGFATAKYSSSGQLLWYRRFSGGQVTRPKSMGCDPQGNVYIQANELGFLVVKYDANGTQQWFRRFNADRPIDMVINPKGYLLLTGYVYNGSQTGIDCYTVKCNYSGDTIWTATYNNPSSNQNDIPNAIDMSLNSIPLTGYTFTSNNSADILTIKYNINGMLQWVRTYGGGNDDGGVDIVNDVSENIYTLGIINGNTEHRYCTIKYLPNGDTAWVRIYHHPQNIWDTPSKVAVDKQGNIIVTGGCYGNDSAYLANYTTVKYDTFGTLLWSNRFGWFSPVSPPNDMCIDNLNNVYIIGARNIAPGYNFNKFELISIKYDPNGVQNWIINYHGSDSIAGGQNIIVDKNFNVYLNGTGDVNSVRGNLLIKYSQVIGIEPISSEIPKNFRLNQNYPNPFNPKTVISFQLAANSYVILKIYDVLGREIAALINEQLKAGIYKIDYDGGNFASGVYYYKLSARKDAVSLTDDFTDTKKMILLK